MTLVAPAASVAHVQAAESDLRASGRISELAYAEGESVEVRDAELVPVEKTPAQG
jgi:valyl-tRNA synthetase